MSGIFDALPGLLQGGTALYNLFGKNNPGRAAGNELGKIAGYGREAYNPFIQQGKSAMEQLGPQYGQMAGNPTDFYNQILGQYRPSEGYKYQEQKLGQQAHNAAAAGGFAGTPGHIQQHSELINQLLGGDMQQYLQNILGIQGKGQEGLQHQADIGYHGAGSLADYLGTAGGRQGNVNAITKDYGNQSTANGLSALAGLISPPSTGGKPQLDIESILKSLFGGGGNQPSQGSQIPLNKTYSYSGGNYSPNWLGR